MPFSSRDGLESIKSLNRPKGALKDIAMARTAIRRAAVIIAMLGVFAFRPPAQAQAGAPPARIQEIMEKARSGQQLTQEEMKALKDWGRSVGNAMRRPAPSPAARSPADASSSNVSSAPAAGAASSVS